MTIIANVEKVVKFLFKFPMELLLEFFLFAFDKDN